MIAVFAYPHKHTESEAIGRENFVQAALGWLSTPYHNNAAVKGAGVDCGMLLICAAKEAKLIPEDFDPGNYSPQWHLNRTAQWYLAIVEKYCVEAPPPPMRGDIVLFQFGHVFSHGAIVVDWPRVIHAYNGREVCIDDASKAQWLAYMGEGNNRPRPMKLMSFWPR